MWCSVHPSPIRPTFSGIGVNYRDHVAETGAALPPAPLVFAKFTGCLTGPTGDIVIASDSTDYEAELVVVVGAPARNVPAEQAWDVVAGVTVGQDVSDRDLQRAGERPQFSLGKSHDTYGPTGPYIVSPDLLADREALPIRCAVNDEVRQDDTTANLIFTVPALIVHPSSMLTLQPGDLVFTGTRRRRPADAQLPEAGRHRADDDRRRRRARQSLRLSGRGVSRDRSRGPVSGAGRRRRGAAWSGR